MLTGKKLVDELRELVDSVERRLWIVSPFIGSWDGVESILGKKWLLKDNINIRLLTDIGNKGSISKETVAKFAQKGELKTLRGLHAKLYVVDNKVLITSANLTPTAFSMRYEIGNIFEFDNNIESIFNNWWNNKEAREFYLDEIQESDNGEYKENNIFEGLKVLNELPDRPITPIIEGTINNNNQKNRKYDELFSNIEGKLKLIKMEKEKDGSYKRKQGQNTCQISHLERLNARLEWRYRRDKHFAVELNFCMEDEDERIKLINKLSTLYKNELDKIGQLKPLPPKKSMNSVCFEYDKPLEYKEAKDNDELHQWVVDVTERFHKVISKAFQDIT